MYWSNDIYYVIGGHEKRKDAGDLTNYRLDRMENLKVSEEAMIPIGEFLGLNPEYKLQDYIDKQVNHFSGEEINLILEFDYEPRTMAILADFAGTNVKLVHLPSGRIQAAVKKMESEALKGWLLKFANRFQIVEPIHLKTEMHEFLIEVMKNYEEISN